jgi:hypothetical protein
MSCKATGCSCKLTRFKRIHVWVSSQSFSIQSFSNLLACLNLYYPLLLNAMTQQIYTDKRSLRVAKFINGDCATNCKISHHVSPSPQKTKPKPSDP